MRSPRKVCLLLALLVGLAVSLRAGEPQAPVTREYQVKAAFLYNFLKFVEWPATNAPPANAPLLIGVAADGPMLKALAATVKDRRINGHELQVQPLHTPAEAKTVHVVFIPASEGKRQEDWLSQVQQAPVLTVGESDAFARRHGMINFVLEADKVRFEIDADAADHAGLTISAQLQKLARAVRRGN